MTEIRFGIIGYGVQGKLYASILTGKSIPGLNLIEQPKNCSLTAVSDRSGKASLDFEQSDRVGVYTDWKKMIDSKACDAVILTVPHFLHPEITIYSLEHGVNVLCEKPAAVRASDVEEMISVSTEHPELSFGLMLNQRTNPVFIAMKKMIDSGELGEIRRSNWIINNWWRPDSYYQSSPWRGTWNGEGGGILVNQAPHQLDLWLWLCGEPSKVYAVCKEGAHRDITVENDVTIVTQYENGATGSLIACTHDPLGTDRLEIDLSGGKIIVENNSKAVVFRFQRDESEWNDTLEQRLFTDVLRRNPDSIYTKEEITGKQEFGSGYVEVFSNFADNIINGTPLIAPGTDGLRSVQLANTAQFSAYLGRQLSFPCEPAAFDEYLEMRMKNEKKTQLRVPVKNIGHTSFNARKMDEMLHFYCDLIGMKPLFKFNFSDLYKGLQNAFGDSPTMEQADQLKRIESMGDRPWLQYLKLADRQYLELFHDGGLEKKELGNRSEYFGYM